MTGSISSSFLDLVGGEYKTPQKKKKPKKNELKNNKNIKRGRGFVFSEWAADQLQNQKNLNSRERELYKRHAMYKIN